MPPETMQSQYSPVFGTPPTVSRSASMLQWCKQLQHEKMTEVFQTVSCTEAVKADIVTFKPISKQEESRLVCAQLSKMQAEMNKFKKHVLNINSEYPTLIEAKTLETSMDVEAARSLLGFTL